MSQSWPSRRAGQIGLILMLLVATAGQSSAVAESLVMHDGRVLNGALATVSGLAENPLKPNPNNAGVRAIELIDNNLTRTFVPKTRVAKQLEGADQQPLSSVKIEIKQHVAVNGFHIARMGPIVRMTDFDKWGRRTVTMMTNKGTIDVIQGITEITPLWTKVEGLAVKPAYIWDMRLATSSIPRETLTKVISQAIDPTKLNDRLMVVKLYINAERYDDAQQELQAIAKDFPDQAGLDTEIRAVQQLHSRRVIEEVNVRRRSGQHRLAYAMLEEFPRKDIAGETLQQVRQMLEDYANIQKQGKEILEALEANVKAIKDSRFRDAAQVVYKEIATDFNIHTLDRMADYQRLQNDKNLTDEQKASLAISGWLLGSNQALTNIAVALSLAEVRNLVQLYLRETVALRKNSLLKSIKSQEGGTPEMVARILANMKPPGETPEPQADKPGFYELDVPSLDKEPNVTYYVQLPPEYDPYRRYPMVITLNGAGTTPEQQIDWWAGAFDGQGNRLGQGTRHGYIVLAVDWAKPDQKEYEYSAREHAAVLVSLRDACRRFSVDTDRVFLSGHSMGGDAAWDLAVAHPDLWAGVIPIVAVADKYTAFYTDNAGMVPFYVVSGELDGDKTLRNARDLDRYLSKRYDVTVVEYRGRGHEHFHDEIQRLFDWMGRRDRNFFPKKIAAATMRTWDNFFWWLELRDFPPGSIVEPINWPPGRGFQPVRSEATIKGNSINVRTAAEEATIWLSPELVDFASPVRITVKGQRLSMDPILRGDLRTMLDDAHARGERLHPFWVKIDSTAPRGGSQARGRTKAKVAPVSQEQ